MSSVARKEKTRENISQKKKEGYNQDDVSKFIFALAYTSA